MSLGASLISVTSVVRLRVDCAAKARTPARLATMDTADRCKRENRTWLALKGGFSHTRIHFMSRY